MNNEKRLKEIFQKLDDTPMPDKKSMLSEAERALRGENRASVDKTVRRLPRLKYPRAIAAACAVAILAVSVFGVYAVAEEQRDWREAVEFFEQHELSTDGYSRREIKLIWRDITSGSFSYGKTADAISELVGGYEITNDALSAEELRELWNKRLAEEEEKLSLMMDGFEVNERVSSNGTSLRYKNQVRYADTAEEAYAVIEKYSGGVLEWSRTMQSTSVHALAVADGYIAMIATAPNGIYNSALIVLSQSGDELWRVSLEENGVSLIAEKDGISVICSDRYMLEIHRYDIDGALTHKATNTFSRMGLDVDMGNYITSGHTVGKALKLGDKYVLQLTGADGADFLVKLDSGAQLLAQFRFSSSGESYSFTDVASCGGDLYISATAVTDADVMDTLERELIAANGTVSDATLTADLRTSHTAMLLKCDIDTGEVKAFYSVEGAFGDTFSLNENGDLIWRVNSIASVTHSVSRFEQYPATAHISGVCSVYEYTFSSDGILLEQVLTDDVASFDA